MTPPKQRSVIVPRARSCPRHYSGLINTSVLTHFGSLKIPRHLVSGCFCTNLAVLAKNSHLERVALPSAPLLSYWTALSTVVRGLIQNGPHTQWLKRWTGRREDNKEERRFVKRLGIKWDSSEQHTFHWHRGSDWLMIGFTDKTTSSFCLVREQHFS